MNKLLPVIVVILAIAVIFLLATQNRPVRHQVQYVPVPRPTASQEAAAALMRQYEQMERDFQHE